MTSALKSAARAYDRTVAQARDRLVSEIRRAHESGMTQTQIAKAIGRSQPEVSRLLRFHGTTPIARTLRQARPQVIDVIKKAGGSNIRVFGSVATGTEHEASDIDLLFHPNTPMGLIALARLELELEKLLGRPVDLVSDTSIRPDLEDRILQEAVPL
ncbi:nucleotidyltransferase domain-containing protein [Schaalia vaccimaxillae]|uniref:nucleotidyltransferase domain-containing protein n=1 Tax=Schaalia vaccimaxillae TaxID=183916 RepID=UPI0003B79CEB|nr:nucleotidyltransferase domain-containing protein [Schaalia vaccimaxillae]